ncbi:MAG: cyclic nucleotide-binding domain-containing protein [Elusimicrobia bacterium]|nr:cyclic nucleotide-binding domain-containing protein [Elusimicrobiota bacterium]
MRPSPADVKWIFGKLRKLDFLTYHSEEELIRLVQSMKKERFRAREAIIRQAQKGEAFYLILRGSVAVWAETPQGPRRLAALAEGESFGEVSILTGEVCNATVTADGEVEVFSLPPVSVRKVVRSNPVLAEKMALAVSQRRGARELGLEPSAASSAGLVDRVKAFFGLAK